MVGGSRGTPFADPAPTAQISKVVIRCGQKIDALRLEYADGTSTVRHGGTGGRDDWLDIEPGQLSSQTLLSCLVRFRLTEEYVWQMKGSLYVPTSFPLHALSLPSSSSY